jgi:hypothetical protein
MPATRTGKQATGRSSNPVTALARDFVQIVKRHAAAMRARQRFAEELVALGPQELGRVLADAGFQRSDLNSLMAHGPHSRELLEGMLDRLAIDQKALRIDRTVMREIEHNCALCETQGHCRRWLKKSEDPKGYRKFCPNAETFDRLLAER